MMEKASFGPKIVYQLAGIPNLMKPNTLAKLTAYSF